MNVRRVVTGHDAEGHSCFVSDDVCPVVFQRSEGSTIVSELWETSSTPAINNGNPNPTKLPLRLQPPAGGTVLRVISYPPDALRLSALHSERAKSSEDPSRAAALDHNNPRHPGFHRTQSLDYAIVLQGEIYALMDKGETLLRQGDVLIQRGTNHAWSNRTDDVAIVAFVLVDAIPIERAV
jgi:hypothetical protein